MNECTLKDNADQCQQLCQDTALCMRFAYITNVYDGQHGQGIRKCCFMKSTVTEDMVDDANVIAGPKICDSGKLLKIPLWQLSPWRSS